MIVHACTARKASSTHLHFKRLDYPEMDPAQWQKWITLEKNSDDALSFGELPIAFWGDLESAYRPRHAENMAAMAIGLSTGKR